MLSSAKQYQECYQRIDSGSRGWLVSLYLKEKTILTSRTLSSATMTLERRPVSTHHQTIRHSRSNYLRIQNKYHHVHFKDVIRRVACPNRSPNLRENGSGILMDSKLVILLYREPKAEHITVQQQQPLPIGTPFQRGHHKPFTRHLNCLNYSSRDLH